MSPGGLQEGAGHEHAAGGLELARDEDEDQQDVWRFLGTYSRLCGLAIACHLCRSAALSLWCTQAAQLLHDQMTAALLGKLVRLKLLVAVAALALMLERDAGRRRRERGRC